MTDGMIMGFFLCFRVKVGGIQLRADRGKGTKTKKGWEGKRDMHNDSVNDVGHFLGIS